jgi:hypothetical protein
MACALRVPIRATDGARVPIGTGHERGSDQVIVGELRHADDVVEGDAADGE